MNKMDPRNWRIPGTDTSVSVADVQRVRRQRRLAQTEEEHATVRVHMRDLAGDLKAKPRSNVNLLKNSGIAVIVLGLIIGGVLFYSADLAWPLWRAFMESLS